MSVYAVLIIVLASDVVLNKIDATSYASLSSSDGNFKLQWTYNNSKLVFKMTCKTTGWCAVGFTTTGDGKNMVNYDIAVAGFASGAGYIGVSIYVWIYENRVKTKSSVFFLIAYFFNLIFFLALAMTADCNSYLA